MLDKNNTAHFRYTPARYFWTEPLFKYTGCHAGRRRSRVSNFATGFEKSFFIFNSATSLGLGGLTELLSNAIL